MFDRPLYASAELKSEQMKNILVISENFLQGGLETQVVDQAETLKSLGVNLHLVTTSNTGDVDVSAFKTVHSGVEFGDGASSYEFLQAISLIEGVIAEHDIELIHAHPFYSLILAFIVSARTGIPYVLTMHGPASVLVDRGPVYNEYIQSSIAFADKVFCVSLEAEALLATRYPGDSAVLPNAVTLSSSPPRKKVRKGKPWMWAGRIDADKAVGLKSLIDWLAPKGVKLDVYGDGPARETLEQYCADAEFPSSAVSFKGWSAKVKAEMPAYDVVAGMGRVVLEGVSAGRPVFLVGYDGLKGILDTGRFEFASYWNFSGRGLPNPEGKALEKQFNAISKASGDFVLSKACIEPFSSQEVWSRYREIVASLDYEEGTERAVFSNAIYASATTEQFWYNDGLARIISNLNRNMASMLVRSDIKDILEDINLRSDELEGRIQDANSKHVERLGTANSSQSTEIRTKIESFNQSIEALIRQADETKADLKKAESARRAAEKSLADQEKRLAKQSADAKSSEAALSEAREALKQSRSQNDKLAKKLDAVTRAKVRQAKRYNRHIRAVKQQQSKEVVMLEQRFTDAAKRIEMLVDEERRGHDATKKAFSRAERDFERQIAELEEDRDTMKKRYDDEVAHRSGVQRELDIVLDELKELKKSLKSEQTRANRELARYDRSLTTVKSNIDKQKLQIEGKIDNVTTKIALQAKDISSVTKDYTRSEKTIDKLTDRLNSLAKEIGSIKEELSDRQAGFADDEEVVEVIRADLGKDLDSVVEQVSELETRIDGIDDGSNTSFTTLQKNIEAIQLSDELRTDRVRNIENGVYQLVDEVAAVVGAAHQSAADMQALREEVAALRSRDSEMLAEIDNKNQELADRDEQLGAAQRIIETKRTELERALSEAAFLQQDVEQALAARVELEHRLKEMSESEFWKASAPFRKMVDGARFLLGDGGKTATPDAEAGTFPTQTAPQPETVETLADEWDSAGDADQDGEAPDEAGRAPTEDAGADTKSVAIAQYVDIYAEGGVERVVNDLCLKIQAAGYTSVLLVGKEITGNVDELRENNIEVFNAGGSKEALAQYLDENDIAVVFSHHAYEFLNELKAADTKVVEILHNAYHWQVQNTYLTELRGNTTHSYIAVSDYVRDFNVKYNRVPSELAKVVNNGLNIRGFVRPPLEMLRQNRLDSIKTPRLLFMANLHTQKNHDVLIAAFERLSKKHPRARLAIAGTIRDSSDFSKKIEKIIADSPARKRLDLLGQINRFQLSKEMSRAHIALLPTKFEGFSIASLEYTFFGLPSVLSDTGAAKLLQSKYGHVAVAEPASLTLGQLARGDGELKDFDAAVEAVADAMDTILNDYEAWLDKALKAAASFDDYSIDTVAESYIDTANTILGRG